MRLLLLTLALAVCAAHADVENVYGFNRAYSWRRVVEAESVDVELHRVPAREVYELTRKHGGASLGRKHRTLRPETMTHGFSILYRRSDGSFLCRAYVALTAPEAIVKHELRHCHGWTH